MSTPQLSVAIPWSLSHYISLNGFHPLYQALFGEKPDGIILNAWDNVELSQRLGGDSTFRNAILKETAQSEAWISQQGDSDIARKYYAHYWSGNHALTRLIPGDIELQHTAPFPSMTRPFIFHCEDFRYIFLPFCLENFDKYKKDSNFIRFYADIFESPLCLGISSHLPGTLKEIGDYFQSPVIDKKLFESGIGIYGRNTLECPRQEKPPINEPVFLFINSANQNPHNFFRRGGHLVLRCWQALMQDSSAGRLIMRCNRPSDAALKTYGVDIDWLHRHTQTNILWIENFLPANEIEDLMQLAHFLLIPSIDLHSVSIMQAMWNGAIPVVSNAKGTDHYVIDGVSGIRLTGAPELKGGSANGKQADEEEDRLLAEMTSRLRDLINQPHRYSTLQSSVLTHACRHFTGSGFSQKFWGEVARACHTDALRKMVSPAAGSGEFVPAKECFISDDQWKRLFASAPQPVARLSTGRGKVTEMGGCFIASPGSQALDIHEWSPLAEYLLERSPHLYFGRTIKELGGRYMGFNLQAQKISFGRRLVRSVSDGLMPYPRLFSIASRFIKLWRRIVGAVFRSARTAVPSNWGDVGTEDDIELLSQLENGLNVIRCGYRYYAVTKSDGAFSKARADGGKFKVCLIGVSIKEILQKVAVWEAEQSARPVIELVEEGVHGYNVIKCDSTIYAIRQDDGAFSIDRVRSGGYRNLHSGSSPEEVKAAILGRI